MGKSEQRSRGTFSQPQIKNTKNFPAYVPRAANLVISGFCMLWIQLVWCLQAALFLDDTRV